MVRDNIEKIRIAKGISKTFLAKKLNLSLQGYRHMLKNTSFDVERLNIVSKAMGVNPGIFFDDELTQSVIGEIESINVNLLDQTGTD